ncbi:formylglycine-generating enzyme family protein [Polaribacter sp.]|uniref:formylglycine-generating enzyme family protein n=1 Tax=Polaribacter sp. TaxID=1920175 RepID=UPI0040475E9A
MNRFKTFCTLAIILLSTFTYATVNATEKPDMVFVKGGSFIMGNGDANKKWAHAATINDYSIGRYEVTVGQYKTFCTATARPMPEAPYWGWNDQHPMVNVTYEDALAYCKWLGQKYGGSWRLPTEAEWEFAAIGSNQTKGYKYSGSNSIEQVAWYYKNANYQMQKVGLKKSNELGLFDMTGNAWEWCSDWYVGFAMSGKINEGTHRILRGGSSMSFETNSNNTLRNFRASNLKIYSAGFRVVTTAIVTTTATPSPPPNPKAELSEFKCETKKTGYAILCRALESNRTIEDEDSPYSYAYEVELARLAEADFDADGDIFFVEKIHLYVTRCSSCMICDTIRSNKKDISLLKVAIATGNLEYLERSVISYRYPLDVVDEKHGMNIMDYVYEENEYWKTKFPGSKEEALILKMYNIVKKAGGKFHKYAGTGIKE